MRALHYDSGSTIEMLCRVRRPPAYQARVVWEARYARAPGQVFVLNQDVIRGGVKGRRGSRFWAHVLWEPEIQLIFVTARQGQN